MIKSPLTNKMYLCDYYSEREDKVKKICVHHTGGVMSVDSLGRWFQSAGDRSSNYGIGPDGTIALFVPEEYRAWTTGSDTDPRGAQIDHQSITIELCNNTFDYKVSKQTIDSLTKLMVDICKRYKIKKVTYHKSFDSVVQLHRWYALTSCPGDYVTKQLYLVVDNVNKILSGVPVVKETKGYKVIVGPFKEKWLSTVYNSLKEQGFTPRKEYWDKYQYEGIIVIKEGGPSITRDVSLFNELRNMKLKPIGLKPYEQIVDEVIEGKWGNGRKRVNGLRVSGYNPVIVQNLVNERLKR